MNENIKDNQENIETTEVHATPSAEPKTPILREYAFVMVDGSVCKVTAASPYEAARIARGYYQ